MGAEREARIAAVEDEFLRGLADLVEHIRQHRFKKARRLLLELQALAGLPAPQASRRERAAVARGTVAPVSGVLD